MITGVPEVLRQTPQWVAYRNEPRAGSDKVTKVPIDPTTGRRAKTNDPRTWAPFEVALRRAHDDGLPGTGFVFTAQDDFVGVDLDHCRDPRTGEVQPWAEEVIRSLRSYTEVSPSGMGLHILTRGSLPSGRRRKGQAEMYSTGRFFTMTGKHIEGSPTTIEDRTVELAALHERLIADAPAAGAHLHGETALSDDDLLEKARRADNGPKFSALWSGNLAGHASHSEADLSLCRILAFWTRNDATRVDRLFRRSGLFRDKWDEARGDQTYGQRTVEKAISSTTETYGGGTEPTPERERDNEATRLVQLVTQSGAVLFHDEDGEPYVTIPTNGHVETYRLKDRAFERRLAHLIHTRLGKVVKTTTIADARRTLESIAVHEGDPRRVFLRVAEHRDSIILDLGTSSWEAVSVQASSWSIRTTSPVPFRRPASARPLPRPTRGGSITRLRDYINCVDDHWPLLLAFIVDLFKPRGPHPALVLVGEQGSAKSTTARVIRSLSDPNRAPVRGPPGSMRDLMATARSSWVVVLDNLSTIPVWLSDALCCLATGAGYGGRALFTDDEEAILDACRPSILTGIGDYVRRADLLDRSLIVEAPTVPGEARRDEASFWRALESDLPAILGALLDAVACGLQRLPHIQLPRLPRLADFARWATACEPALGLPDGAVIRALQVNATDANSVALEASPIAPLLLALVDERLDVEMPAEALLRLLTDRLPSDYLPHGWPKNAQALSGALSRLAPCLRVHGIEFHRRRAEGNRRRLLRLRKVPQEDRPHRPSRPQDGPSGSSQPEFGQQERTIPPASRTVLSQDVVPQDGGTGSSPTATVTEAHAEQGAEYDPDEEVVP